MTLSPLMIVGYIAFSLAAIGALALLMNALGLSKAHRFADTVEALAELEKEHPGLGAKQSVLGANSQAALIELAEEGRFALVRAMGHFSLTRIFSTGDLVNVDQDHARLSLRFADFADPVFSIMLDSEDEARYWAGLIAGKDATHA